MLGDKERWVSQRKLREAILSWTEKQGTYLEDISLGCSFVLQRARLLDEMCLENGTNLYCRTSQLLSNIAIQAGERWYSISQTYLTLEPFLYESYVGFHEIHFAKCCCGGWDSQGACGKDILHCQLSRAVAKGTGWGGEMGRPESFLSHHAPLVPLLGWHALVLIDSDSDAGSSCTLRPRGISWKLADAAVTFDILGSEWQHHLLLPRDPASSLVINWRTVEVHKVEWTNRMVSHGGGGGQACDYTSSHHLGPVNINCFQPRELQQSPQSGPCFAHLVGWITNASHLASDCDPD